MWAHLTDGAWTETRHPIKLGGISYPPNILTLWTETALGVIGIRLVTVVQPEAGQRATGWELVGVDGLPVRRPTGTETIPTPPPPDLTRLQFWMLVRALDKAGMGMTTRLNAAKDKDGPMGEAITDRLAHANTYSWPEFLALAAALDATEAQIAVVETAWREAGA